MAGSPKATPNDPKGLIREAFRIDGISEPECRSIFMDWALSLPADTPQTEAIEALIALHGAAHPAHPMSRVLRAGLAAPARSGRRGGWRSRRPATPES
ncbi:MAG: hypothetical protein AAGB05_04665 [Pseudomonadota bacterium]